MLFDFIIAIKSVAADFFHKNNQLQHLLHFLCELLFVSSLPIMDSTPPTSRRLKSRAVRSGGRLEGWFSGDNDLIERYRFETSTKVINNPKVVCFDWLKSQKLDNIRRLLKDQSLRKFLEMKGNIYPDLIRVFYTNLKFEGNNLVSHVKGVDMEITYDVWTAVAGLKYSSTALDLVPHQVLLLILKKVNMLMIWIFYMKINLKHIKMLDQVLVLEIKKKECKLYQSGHRV